MTPERVGQVVDNLVANAVDAVTLAGTAGPRVVISAQMDATTTTVRVSDNGPGMTPEQLEHAFDRFWRADQRRTDLSGSGLGLAIAKRLVEADGGTVELGSTPGERAGVHLRYRRGARTRS